MTIAYFDCCSGISGDMALGALLDCGVPVDALRDGLSTLPVAGWTLDAKPILQQGMHALDVRIALDERTDADELQQVRQQASAVADHGHHHDEHSHIHQHGREDDGHGNHGHAHHGPHAHGRSLAEIRDLIGASAMSERIKRQSLAIFERIARAEAQIHHTTPEDVHFHEIGGVDSLIDICGVAWCLEYLQVDQVRSSALPYFTGFVDCAHGRIPLPAPATLELLKGVPMIPTDVDGELVTPTGAGLLSALCQSFGPPPPMTFTKIGVGAGKKRFSDRPNVLRVMVGEAATAATSAVGPVAAPQLDGLEWKNVVLVETNLDDMNPELFQYVMERLFKAGALDVWMQPIQMKKNRPALLLSALCDADRQSAVVATVLKETTTLGVRVSTVQRAALPRQSEAVETKFGRVRVKIAYWPEQNIWRGAPEYDDVARLAAQHEVPAREVSEAVMQATLEARRQQA